jgi:hypothetical protein
MPVAAQTSQGLEWGFESDDVFHFMMHFEADSLTIDEEIYLEFNETLAEIPDIISDWTDIPWVRIDAYYANGTSMGFEVIALLAAMNIHLPIGNWDLLSSLALTTLNLENLTLDAEDPFFWGYSWQDDTWELTDGNFTLYSNYTLSVHVDYLNIDGFLSHYALESFNTTTREKTGEVTLNRLGIEEYTDATAPTLDHPADIEYIEGETGNSITWHPMDDYPASYQITVLGAGQWSGVWNSTTEEIVVNVDGLITGEHNYTIVVADTRGNTASDVVIVRVSSPPAWPYIVVFVVAGVVVVIVAIFVRRR